MTLADDTPVLWLRARSPRTVVRRHLAHLRGLFAADGWSVHEDDTPPEIPSLAVLAVLDDPWAEPFPELARRLAETGEEGRPVWRVPRTNDGPGPQAWTPRRVPHTLRAYRRAALARRSRELDPSPPNPWTGFAAAPAVAVPQLLRAGWPPAADRVALAPHLGCYRYDDPADHERRELDPFMPEEARYVVDVGCGHGRFGERLRRPGRQVIGIEPDPGMARQAATRLDRVLAATAEEALPRLSQAADCVIFADVLEHLDDPAVVLRAARELLAPNGRVVVSLPNSAWAPILRDLAAGRWDPTLAGVQARDHVVVFTPSSFADLARECGLEVERMEPLSAPLPWTLRLWARIVAWTAGGDPRWLAAPQWVVVLAPAPHP